MRFELPREVFFPLAAHTALFVLVIAGLIPRGIVPFWTLALLTWAAWVPARTSIPFFAAAIPLFIAVPITAEYDNLTMWRPLAIVIFLRWFLASYSRADLISAFRNIPGVILSAPRRWPMASAVVILFLTALASLSAAGDLGIGIRRVILFTNVVMVPVVLWVRMRNDRDVGRLVVSGIAYSAAVVVIAAFVQLGSTYLMDIYQFMRIWGEGIQLRQFGALWSHIAVWLGNTWFAYYGPQLSLRVFSLFPDSHSFPVYLILAVSGLLAFSVRSLMERASGTSWRILARTRAHPAVIWIPPALLAVILSGTRGIWLAAAGLPLVVIIVRRMLRSYAVRRGLWLWLSSFIVVLALLFVVAYPIFTSPQFLLQKGDRNLFRERLRSVLDFGETSNAQRLAIWSRTIRSIGSHPFLGVGIGNFPTVLEQNLFLARAGSTAHNIYLHIAAEMGVAALAAWLWLWAILYRRVFLNFRGGSDGFWLGYHGWLLLALPWVAAYLLTDAALFDERTLLVFGLTAALVAGRSAYSHD